MWFSFFRGSWLSHHTSSVDRIIEKTKMDICPHQDTIAHVLPLRSLRTMTDRLHISQVCGMGLHGLHLDVMMSA
jgi:hypothetical protein